MDLYDPILTLLLTSSELSLKAFLLKANVTEAFVRKCGHHIDKLLVAAVEHGLMVAVHECEEIFLMATPYTSNAPRYLPLGEVVVMRPVNRLFHASAHMHERSAAFINNLEPDGPDAFGFPAVALDDIYLIRDRCRSQYAGQVKHFNPTETWPAVGR